VSAGTQGGATGGVGAAPSGAGGLRVGRGTRTWQVVLGIPGAAAAAYGVWLLLAEPLERLVAIVVWAAGGVIAHDGLVAPAVVLLGVVAATRAPGWLRLPLVRLLVVLGPLTLVAVPVLGRFGARPDNATLLDRPYWAGYLVLVAIAVVLTAVDALRRRAGVDGARRPDGGHRAPPSG
jgi:hypothetical protein